jgi:hypothetical protein
MKISLSIAAAAVVLVGIVCGPKVLAQAAAPSGWNQFCESFEGARIDFGRVNSRVKQLGSEGFELATMSNTGMNGGITLFVCFKRPGK